MELRGSAPKEKHAARVGRGGPLGYLVARGIAVAECEQLARILSPSFLTMKSMSGARLGTRVFQPCELSRDRPPTFSVGERERSWHMPLWLPWL